MLLTSALNRVLFIAFSPLLNNAQFISCDFVPVTTAESMASIIRHVDWSFLVVIIDEDWHI